MLQSVPGKAFEMTCYAGGVNAYGPEIRGYLDTWKGKQTDGQDPSLSKTFHPLTHLSVGFETVKA